MTERVSNSLFLTVLPARSLEGVGWTVRVLSERDYASPVALVERFAGLGFTVEANAEGGATVSLDSDDPVFTASLPAGETVRLQDQEALWQILEDGDVRFEFLAEDVDEDVIPDNGGPRQTVIAGRGTGSVLEWAPVLPAGMPTPSSMTRTFTGFPMAAWAQLFADAQADGYLDWVSLTFDAAGDSAGTPWAGSAQNLEVSAGETLLDLLKRWCETNGYSWRMLPGWRLEVVQNPGIHHEDTIVFTQFRSQGEHKRKISRRELANVIYADSGDKGIAIAQDSGSVGKWRKRAAWLSAGDAGDASSRSMVANTSLSLSKDQKLARSVRIIPDREGRHPLVDFGIHDWIRLEVSDDDTESGVQRVLGLAVDINADGLVEYEATMQSKVEARAVKTQRILDKLGGSARSGSGSATSAPIPVSRAISAVKIEDLSDVDVSAPAAGSVLEWNGARWIDALPAVPPVPSLDDLTDVATAGKSAGKVLQFDGSLWVPVTPAAGGATTLDGLADVTSPAPADGQTLTWESASSQWKPKTPAAGGGSGGTVPADTMRFRGAWSSTIYRYVNLTFDSQTWPAGTVQGAVPWTINNQADSGAGTSWAARSGNIGNSGLSEVSFPLVWEGSTTDALLVRYYVQSEGGYDWFRVYLDGAQQFQNGGVQSGFLEASITGIAAGTRTVKLAYSTDSSVLSGFNGVFVSRLQQKVVDNSDPYKLGHVVTHSGGIWMLQAGSGSETPATSSTQWKQLG